MKNKGKWIIFIEYVIYNIYMIVYPGIHTNKEHLQRL